jgi:hypothetical protein
MEIPDSPTELAAELVATGFVLWLGVEILTSLP